MQTLRVAGQSVQVPQVRASEAHDSDTGPDMLPDFTISDDGSDADVLPLDDTPQQGMEPDYGTGVPWGPQPPDTVHAAPSVPHFSPAFRSQDYLDTDPRQRNMNEYGQTYSDSAVWGAGPPPMIAGLAANAVHGDIAVVMGDADDEWEGSASHSPPAPPIPGGLFDNLPPMMEDRMMGLGFLPASATPKQMRGELVYIAKAITSRDRLAAKRLDLKQPVPSRRLRYGHTQYGLNPALASRMAHLNPAERELLSYIPQAKQDAAFIQVIALRKAGHLNALQAAVARWKAAKRRHMSQRRAQGPRSGPIRVDRRDAPPTVVARSALKRVPRGFRPIPVTNPSASTPGRGHLLANTRSAWNDVWWIRPGAKSWRGATWRDQNPGSPHVRDLVHSIQKMFGRPVGAVDLETLKLLRALARTNTPLGKAIKRVFWFTSGSRSGMLRTLRFYDPRIQIPQVTVHSRQAWRKAAASKKAATQLGLAKSDTKGRVPSPSPTYQREIRLKLLSLQAEAGAEMQTRLRKRTQAGVKKKNPVAVKKKVAHRATVKAKANTNTMTAELLRTAQLIQDPVARAAVIETANRLNAANAAAQPQAGMTDAEITQLFEQFGNEVLRILSEQSRRIAQLQPGSLEQVVQAAAQAGVAPTENPLIAAASAGAAVQAEVADEDIAAIMARMRGDGENDMLAAVRAGTAALTADAAGAAVQEEAEEQVAAGEATPGEAAAAAEELMRDLAAGADEAAEAAGRQGIPWKPIGLTIAAFWVLKKLAA